MSLSTCWADSLTPIGMPPLRSRTSSAKCRKSSTPCQSGNVGGDTAGVPSGRPRTSAMRPFTFGPGRCPPVPVFAPCPSLKWNACTFVQHVPASSRSGPTRARRSSGSSRPAPRGACRPRPSRCRCPRAGRRAPAPSSPPARARRTTCPRRTAGCRATAAWRAFGPMHTSVPTGTSSSSGRRASCAVTNWIVVPARAAAGAARPSPRRTRGDRPSSGRSAASSWIRITYGSSIVPCGSM